MASKTFCEFFEKNSSSKYFYFEEFSKFYIATPKTPTKIKINSSEDNFNLEEAKDCLVTNLLLNTYFLKNDRYLKDDISNLCNLLQTSSYDQNSLAQIIFLIHFSKANADNDLFSFIFSKFDTIEIVQIGQELSFLLDFFYELKRNEHIKSRILQVVQNFCTTNAKFDFENLNISFFDCSIEKLFGMAGINRIYIAYHPLFVMYIKLKTRLKKQDLNLILKLEFMRIFVHETTHVVLRLIQNDLNSSSPICCRDSHEESQLEKYESGIMTEIAIFKQRIDWMESGLSKNFQIEKWREFYENLFRKNNIEINFDIDGTGIVNKKGSNLIMAIDFEYKSFLLE